ncbi:hypothetical protein [Profundibacter amoris]|uniref:Uncharacterized protein n=1 Tax=Profundibacter amoris TaxID=2171755 RepID=A0A347UHP2_9RHOB|nr:hypothetical protein [Profundibacter amoris]AXX98370.1 hypothetical protein BAR1_10790 [Profundibacter amoris]
MRVIRGGNIAIADDAAALIAIAAVVAINYAEYLLDDGEVNGTGPFSELIAGIGNVLSSESSQPGIGHNSGGLQDDGSFITPDGNVIGNHGNQTGEGYIDGKGHTPESVDGILNEPAAQGPGARHDNSTGEAREGTTVTVGPNGDWAVTNTKTGKVIQVNDRNNSKQKTPEFDDQLESENDDSSDQ